MRRLFALFFLPVALLIALASCRNGPGDPKQAHQGTCTETTCGVQDDTIRVTATWLAPGMVPDPKTRPQGEVIWSVRGVIQNLDNQEHDITYGTLYDAYYFHWRDEGYPRITITVDVKNAANVQYRCAIFYATTKGVVQRIHLQEHIIDDPIGSVTCSTDAYTKQIGA